jgi:hypothetical protein
VIVKALQLELEELLFRPIGAQGVASSFRFLDAKPQGVDVAACGHAAPAVMSGPIVVDVPGIAGMPTAAITGGRRSRS